ncbi:MAG: FtsX-like permease family protein, partial [Ktedonobacterales bacterium]
MRTETAVRGERRGQRGEGEADLTDSYRGMAPQAALQLAFWRLGRSFRLLLAVGMGMLVAVALICTVPLYSNLVLNVQLQRQLSVQAPSDLNIETDTTLSQITSSSVGAVLNHSASSANQFLKGFAPTSTWYLSTETYFPLLAVNHTPLPNSRYSLPAKPVLQPYLFNLPEALPHMDIVAGRLPKPTAAGQTPEILVVKEMGLKPGDTLSIRYSRLTLKVVGVWIPKSVSDPFWNGIGSDFTPFFPPCLSNCSPNAFPVLFDQTTFFDLFGTSPGAIAPGSLSLGVHYISFTIPSRITVANTPEIITAISTYRSNLNGALYRVAGVDAIGVGTQLDSILRDQQQQFERLAQPLYIIIIPLVGLALLFVAAMASLLIENQATDIATLKSRGASRTQLLLIYCLQGLPAAIVAALAGPFLAASLSLVIVRFFIPNAATTLRQQTLSSGSVAAQISSPQLVLEPALAGALLGLLALLVAAWTAERRDVLALRREAGRQQHTPFWQRTNLDLGLVLLAIAGYLELDEFGGVNVLQQQGQSSSGGDPLQLAAPGLLLLAGALLALRLFPLATRAVAWLTEMGRGATGMLAFAELDRVSGQFARLALLLSLATGLGIFALTFQASLVGNTLADARFLVGCDERIVLQSPDVGMPPTAPFAAQLAAMPGVKAVTPAYRSLADLSDGTNVDILGIDPSSFAQVAYWRTDYASQPLAKLLSQMQKHAQGPDAGDRSHPIWALIDTQLASYYRLAPGVVFTLGPQGDNFSTPLFFVVEAIVAHFPTLDGSTVSGQVVFNLADYANAITGLREGIGENVNFIGPNEYWLQTIDDAAAAAKRATALRNPNLWVQSVIKLTTVEQQALDDPLFTGMTGLLVIGAASAALLAVFGSAIQASVVARKRLTEFAILRALGGQRPQLVGILLTQQMMVYGFGLVIGSILGVILSTLTLPFLQFSTGEINPYTQQLPPYLLSFNTATIAGFYMALLVAFGLALFI